MYKKMNAQVMIAVAAQHHDSAKGIAMVANPI
jgi:hypothetical protein